MATHYCTHSDPFSPVSPADSAELDQPESSWYRHSSHTGHGSGVRSVSPISANKTSFLFNESKHSSLDPRRITPTLHASLVAEILNLRRELDTKNAAIDDLEANLHSTKSEAESVNHRFQQTLRDSKVHRETYDAEESYLQSITHGLIQERDAALAAGLDLRDQLNAITVKSRQRERDFEQWQRAWEDKTRAWDNEKRNLNIRVHTTESQLRALIQEIRAANLVDHAHGAEGSAEPGSPKNTPRPITPRHERTSSGVSGRPASFLDPTPPRVCNSPCIAARTLAEELDAEDNSFDVSKLVGDDALMPSASDANEFDSQFNATTSRRVGIVAVDNALDLPAETASEINYAPSQDDASPVNHCDIPPQLAEEQHITQNLDPSSDPNLSLAVGIEADGEIGASLAHHLVRRETDPNLQQLSHTPPPLTASVGTQTTFTSFSSPYVDAAVQTGDLCNNVWRFEPTDDHLHIYPQRSITPAGQASGCTSPSLSIQETASTRHDSLAIRDSQQSLPSISVLEMVSSFGGRSNRDSRDTMSSVSVREFGHGLESRGNREALEPSHVVDTLCLDANEPGIESGHSSMLVRDLARRHTSDAPTANSNSMVLEYAENDRSHKDDDSDCAELSARSHDSSHHGLRTSFHSRASTIATVDSSEPSATPQTPRLIVMDRSSSRMSADNLAGDVAGPEPPRESTPGTSARSSSDFSIHRLKLDQGDDCQVQNLSARRRVFPTRLEPIRSVVYENDLEDAEDTFTSAQEEKAAETLPALSLRSQDAAQFSDDASLVDSIAAAMVGEWMWKCPQKRRSFGVVESGKELGINAKDAMRQKRWFWVSPYERTIMWSSKQPIGGSQLMGSRGRKLLIRSVFDITDASASLPRLSNCATCYSRSIVVLTPDRALKITAPNKDRHDRWLMALSFLSNPSLSVPDIPDISRKNTDAAAILEQRPGHARSATLEQKGSGISASVSKATAARSGPQIANGCNLSVPVSSSLARAQKQDRDGHKSNSLAETGYSLIPGPPSTSLNTRVYQHPDIPMGITDIQTHSFRRDKKASKSRRSIKDGGLSYEGKQALPPRVPSPKSGAERQVSHSARRLPLSLTSLVSFRRDTIMTQLQPQPPLSPPFPADRSDLGPCRSSDKPSTVRMKAFINSNSNPSLPISPGLARPLPVSVEELIWDVKERRLNVQISDPAQFEAEGNPRPNFAVPGRHLVKCDLSQPATPATHDAAIERRARNVPSQPPTGDSDSRISAPAISGPLGTELELDSMPDSVLGLETSVQGGQTGKWRRSFTPATAQLGRLNPIPSATLEVQTRRLGGDQKSAVDVELGKPADSVPRTLPSYIGLNAMRRQGYSADQDWAAGDVESLLRLGRTASVRSAETEGSKAISDKRQLGYVFDDEGKDPFQGF